MCTRPATTMQNRHFTLAFMKTMPCAILLNLAALAAPVTAVHAALETVLISDASTPEIQIQGTNGEWIANADATPQLSDGTLFGLTTNCPIERSFIITNAAAGLLLLTNTPVIELYGSNTNGFEIIQYPTNQLTGNSSASFSIRFTPVAAGTRTVDVLIQNNDTSHSNEAYRFSIAATVPCVNLFTRYEPDITPIINGRADWADINNDGWLDLFISGRSSTGLTSALYLNYFGTYFIPQNNPPAPSETTRTAWGDYDNDGDLDLALCGFMTNNMPGTHLYRNDQPSNGFTLVETSLTPVYNGDLAWADYNNDGWLDLALCGYMDTSNNVTHLFRNCRDGSFTNSNIAFTGVRDGSLSWADYDADGWFDLLVSGESDGSKITRLYHNSGTTFSNSTISLPGMSYGKSCWVDVDHDGDLDLALSGYGTAGIFTRIYRYNGGSSPFQEIENTLPGCWLGDMDWADYDNDGDADLFLTGLTASSTPMSMLFDNDGTGLFSLSVYDFPATKQSFSAWADWNCDGFVDLLYGGRSSNGSYAVHSYKNQAFIYNTPPEPPQELTCSITNGYEAELSWSEGSDNQTPPSALSYMIYAGTNLNAVQNRSPMAAVPVGQRFFFENTTALRTRTFTLPFIPWSNTIYWGVQSIDEGGAGSSFQQGPPISRTPLPDFTISSISYQSIPFEVYVSISNQSPTAGDAGILSLWLNHPETATNAEPTDYSMPIDRLDGYACTSVTFSNFPAADAIATNTLRVFINSQNTTEEEPDNNNQATLDYTTEVFDSFSFQAFSFQTSNRLRWSQPTRCGLLTDTVLVRFSTSSFPSALSEGTLLYQGTNQTMLHTDLTLNQPYYYTIWVSNDDQTFINPPD